MSAALFSEPGEQALVDAKRLLIALKEKGCRVESDGTDLFVTPARLLTDDDKTALRKNKRAVLLATQTKRHERQKTANVISRTDEAAFEKTIRETLAAEWGCRPSEVRVWSPRDKCATLSQG